MSQRRITIFYGVWCSKCEHQPCAIMGMKLREIWNVGRPPARPSIAEWDRTSDVVTQQGLSKKLGIAEKSAIRIDLEKWAIGGARQIASHV